jgi:hypothetical protein
MGASTSSYENLNQSLTEVMTSVISRQTANVSSSSVQSNKISGLVVSGNMGAIDQSNVSNINLKMLVSLTTSGDIQSKLIAAVTQKIKENSSPIGYANSQSKISNIVSNVINTNMNSTNINELSANVSQSNEISDVVVLKTGVIDAINQSNASTIVQELTSTMATQITQEIEADTELSNDLELVKSNVLTDLVTNPWAWVSFIFVVIVILIAVGIKLSMRSGEAVTNDATASNKPVTGGYYDYF